MESDPHKPDQQHEHYSVDEMLERLKQSDSNQRPGNADQEGELITRPDGSQVIKVRKHKRRSKQRAKKTNPKTKWTILASLIGLSVVIIAGMVFIIAKYNGSSFKKKTETTISMVTGAESTELTQLRVTPLSATESKASITWANDSFLHSAIFSGIKAQITATSFLSRSWIGEEIVAQQGDIQLQIPTAPATKPDSPIVSPYRFGSLRCDKLNLRFGPERDAPSITGTQASLRQNVDKGCQILFGGGVIQISKWAALEISSGILSLNTSRGEIEARLAAGDNLNGEILIKGDFARDTKQPLALNIESRNFPIQELLGKDLGRIIKGNINSDMGALSFDYRKQKGESLSFVMPFNSDKLSISELPMLTDLEALTGDTKYLRPAFGHCKGTIIRSTNGVTLDHLHLVSNRLITLKGNISVDPIGLLSGKLEVGIPARFFGRNNPAPAIFSEPRDGYIQTSVTLSGSIHNPHDNLNEQLKASKGAQQNIPAGLKKSEPLKTMTPEEKARKKEKDFEELTR